MSKTKKGSKSKLKEMLSEHPYQLVLYLSMFGSAVLFLFILIAFFATSPSATIYWSEYFSYSTAILLLSSYPVSRLTYLFETERYVRLIRSFVSIMFFGSLFVILQLCGWSDMKTNGNMNDLLRQNDFMYVLSGLHIVHLATLLLVTAYFAVYYGKKLSDPVQALVVGTNPYEKLRISLISQSWLFLHFIWAIIFIAFLLGQS